MEERVTPIKDFRDMEGEKVRRKKKRKSRTANEL